MLEMLLHCADTANPTRPEPIYRQWAARVMEEFYQQGDLERASNLPVAGPAPAPAPPPNPAVNGGHAGSLPPSSPR